jgi:hypothetical protein
MPIRNVSAQSPSNIPHNVRLQGEPDQCPRCHRSLVPKLLSTVARHDGPGTEIEEIRQCTSHHCGGAFVSAYREDSPGIYCFIRSVPVEPKAAEVPDEVAQLSPVFVETYSQAIASETYGLKQLTGIGLRKALEFLVKDFAIKEHPTEEKKICAKLLGACIQEYVADPSVRDVAKRAAWLGNDETHYLRRWEDKDVNDLKILIRLTINGIDNVLLARRYISEMPEKKDS